MSVGRERCEKLDAVAKAARRLNRRIRKSLWNGIALETGEEAVDEFRAAVAALRSPVSETEKGR